MLSLDAFDLDELAGALADQENFDSHWLLDRRTGEVWMWTADGESDEDEELDREHLVEIEPIPSHEWYADLADFAAGVGDEELRGRLAAAVEGSGAFRRFRDAVWETPYEAAWNEWRGVRSRRRAVLWLADEELVDAAAAEAYVAEHPDPALP